MFKEAFIHGRFQPPHIQHLEYMLTAKERCSFLWIGITRYDVRSELSSPAAPYRVASLSNPLTYFERVETITEMLIAAGIQCGEFSCVPFPIEQPEKITDFMRTDIPCFTTICDQWNHHKIKVLEGLGFQVNVLWDRSNSNKGASGTIIRQKALANDSSWLQDIPPGAQEILKRIDFPARLQLLANSK